MTTKPTATEGDLLIAELTRRGRRAYLGGDRGAADDYLARLALAA